MGIDDGNFLHVGSVAGFVKGVLLLRRPLDDEICTGEAGGAMPIGCRIRCGTLSEVEASRRQPRGGDAIMADKFYARQFVSVRHRFRLASVIRVFCFVFPTRLPLSHQSARSKRHVDFFRPERF
jgi:hypothetical protein